MSLPVVAVVVGSWVWVVDCELPNQDHIQLFCFWAVAWLFEYTVEATRLIMKIVFSEIHLSSIKPVVSVLIEYLYYRMKILKGKLRPLLYFQAPTIYQNLRTASKRQIRAWIQSFSVFYSNPLNHVQSQLTHQSNCDRERFAFLLMASFSHDLEVFSAAEPTMAFADSSSEILWGCLHLFCLFSIVPR